MYRTYFVPLQENLEQQKKFTVAPELMQDMLKNTPLNNLPVFLGQESFNGPAGI